MLSGLLCSAFTESYAEVYQLKQLENWINQHREQQVLMGYELGEVNWSLRKISTLGTGTHTILSPTGGWEQADLEKRAVERARQNLERLSTELFKKHLDISQCQWSTRSKLFQAKSPLWMSDGSIHLSAITRFEVFQGCQAKGLQKEGLAKHNRSSLLQWWTRLEDRLQKSKREVIFIELTGQTNELIHNCLQLYPRVKWSQASQKEAVKLFDKSSLVRWFWSTVGSDSEQLQKKLTPGVNLGKATCVSSLQEGVMQFHILDANQEKLFLDYLGKISMDTVLELWVWMPTSSMIKN